MLSSTYSANNVATRGLFLDIAILGLIVDLLYCFGLVLLIPIQDCVGGAIQHFATD